MRTILVLPCLLVACTTRIRFDDINIDGQIDDVNGNVDNPDDGIDDPPDTTGDAGPVEIVSSVASCLGHGKTLYEVDTLGLTAGGRFFQEETGNNPPHWTDNHTLESVAPEDDTDHLERVLLDGSTLYDPVLDWQTDVSTVFWCDIHVTDPNVMTFAVAVDDTDGNQADCVVYGEDPEGMIDHVYDRINEPDFNLAECRIVRF